jgi:hypothetical protein
MGSSLNKSLSLLCQEEKVLETNNLAITRELHIIRAHLLHYASLLEDFRKSVQFVLDTPNPAMDSDSFVNDEKTKDRRLLEQESHNLLSEIKRLEMSRTMQDKRLKNVMNLVGLRITRYSPPFYNQTSIRCSAV